MLECGPHVHQSCCGWDWPLTLLGHGAGSDTPCPVRQMVPPLWVSTQEETLLLESAEDARYKQGLGLGQKRGYFRGNGKSQQLFIYRSTETPTALSASAVFPTESVHSEPVYEVNQMCVSLPVPWDTARKLPGSLVWSSLQSQQSPHPALAHVRRTGRGHFKEQIKVQWGNLGHKQVLPSLRDGSSWCTSVQSGA